MKIRAISPVIATVIILAVTVAIAIAVIGWITGLFGATTSGTEQLIIYPDSKLYCYTSSATAILHIMNKGTADSVIDKIEIAGLGTTDSFTVNGQTVDEYTLTRGSDATIEATISSTCTAGASYQVIVYTKSGYMVSTVIVAETGSQPSSQGTSTQV
ncbi:archaellin/type IV pilin N-terminal domain-containing protein [Hyperthermus butylicus]|uniref:Archaeal Type IV pilin N-terminal domain-containing protein n=1 Tax=Hyperthermus butylicus (strain DSM 5456 / JCM 9403 / PLM1-5) TaxID=415426 RepID=A2BJP0_HYPBU|nr:archaellin/type IV pilin N-terminal domain-containing protein [Hyperthermus butylicus]ABM80201.1 hypothetical protein Hbut_0329 [Hyperthermus butylicus DSM 5456]